MELIKVLVENQNGVLVTTSNRVAQELGVKHYDLLEKIDGYISKFSSTELSVQFYIPSNYKALNGRTVKNYLITEKGIAQLVGGYNASVPIAFDLNVAYINEFEKMKKALKQPKPMSIPELIVMQGQWMVEAESRMNNIENNVIGLANTIENNDKSIKRLENNQRRTVTSNHLTVIAYANIKGIKPKSYHAPSIGKKATKICREKDLLIGTTVDSRYGLINTYPVEVLDEIFFE
ncbi:Rha family transcriptional regulator [Leptotrichia sp. oral taxon 498]|uniref:Rha family transcriptional regulator n=1 Tax=Leptotrichia sp. oral taxon 498 TaxID=712368 RepID=UPI000B8CE8EA|nr:Rha family transcriptional regulator [Leptotrichia sp. oral taxon 498]